MFVPYLKIFLCCFVVFAITKRVSENCERCAKTRDKFRDVPLKTDLHGYMAAVKKIIKFCNERKIDLDLNFSFGIFLMQVNLKKSLWSSKLISKIRSEMYDILEENEKLLQYFRIKVANTTTKYDKTRMNIKALFLKELPWVKNISRFKRIRPERLLFRPDFHAGKTDSDWIDYLEKMPNYEMWIPSPDMSDYCIALLATIPVTKPELTCKVPGMCHFMLINGTNFGYALTHRILFLLHAHFGRGCSIYSLQEDERIRNELCGHAYEEAQYIAIHDYHYIDLLMEQIALCSLDGHSEFIHRSWLKRILLHQTSNGCFGETLQRSIHTGRSRQDRMSSITRDLLDGPCNVHLTAVAAAALGAAVRFIIEVYY